MTIAVVIPFFQTKPGLLAQAVASVFAQVDIDDVRIVVIDDASPRRVADEMAAFGTTRFPVHVISQSNAGPAAARNAGLASLGSDVARVAFLDSDDVWTERHLSHAMRALDAGYDFYFADLMQPGQQVGGFARAGRIAVDDHPLIEPGLPLHTFAGDMFDQIISGNIIGTSTVVYDFQRFPAQRFDEAFFSAGEDYLFWIACARAGARFCFSSDVEARYGYGVNVYAGSGWGTDGYLTRIQNEMRYRKRLLDFDLDERQRALVHQKIRTLRYEFANDVVHRVSHRKPIAMDVIRAQVSLDIATILALPIQAGQIVAKQLKGRPGNQDHS